MEKKFELPITRIGENDWKNKLGSYLKSRDIEFKGLPEEKIIKWENNQGIKLPQDIYSYYLYFGSTDSSDFMYGLKKIDDLEFLFAANLTFVNLNFKMYQINTMVFFAESPANDPLCFDKDSGEIYLFSHDPVEKARVFSDFNQYLLYEIIETEKLVGDGIKKIREDELKKEYLSGEGINYNFRNLKLI